jgi:signal transduction histidine kinase
VLHFRLALAFRAATLLLLSPFFLSFNEISLLLVGTFLVETAMYEPFPRNLILTTAFFVVVLAVRAALSNSLIAGQADFFLLGSLLILLSCFFTRYREEIIAVVKERDKLKAMVVDLARTNLQYLDYATEAAKSGIEEERLRITRDIHDIVGYTLTNNIAMMEAATDMMRRNPLGIPALLKAARENAQEGLQQIRAALYRLREQREPAPKGIRALVLLCGFFQKATHIEVDFSAGNARGEYSAAVDSAVYHLIQEALLNAFRHGKAPLVRVSLWESESELLVAVGDDGVGASTFKEGIGLRGMRERLEALSGELRITARPGSFTVHARIPIQGETDGG